MAAAAVHQAQLFAARQKRTSSLRRLLLGIIAAYYTVKTFHKQLWPWGRPVPWDTRAAFGSIDYANTRLQDGAMIRKVFPLTTTQQGDTATTTPTADNPQRLLKGTETILVDAKGNMFGMTEEGNLLSFTDMTTSHHTNDNDDDDDGRHATTSKATAKVTVIKNLGMGRPLGGDFAKDGTLWIADAVLGLMRLQNPTSDSRSKVELVANSIPLSDGTTTISPFLFTNDLVVGPVSGKIYFTDSSTVAPTRNVQTRTWDTMYAAKSDIFRAQATGRLLEYDPAIDKLVILATGLRFANGVAVNGDESYLVVSETAGMRMWKYHLKGTKAGQMEILVSDMPGYPDGVSCSPDGQCFAVMPSAIVPLHRLTAKLPDFVDLMLRHLLLALPRQLAPKVKPFGGLVQVNANTGDHQYYLDPTGTNVAHFTGATYAADGKVYLGSLQNEYIAIFTPEK